MKNEGQDNQLGDIFERLFAMEPSQDELDNCAAFLEEQSKHFKSVHKDDTDAAERAMASLCQVLLASNRFLYVD